MGIQFQRIDIHHDLAIASTKRLRHRRPGHVGDLVSHGVLAKIAQLGFVQSLTLERDQADRKAGGVEFKNHGRQRTRRQSSQIGHGEIGNRTEVGVGVSPGLEIDLDQADARQRSRFDVIDSAAQREETFERIGDVGFNLLRRHSGVERRHHHHGNVDGGKEVDGHAHQRHCADDCHHQTRDNDEERVFNGKSGHQDSASWFSGIGLGST